MQEIWSKSKNHFTCQHKSLCDLPKRNANILLNLTSFTRSCFNYFIIYCFKLISWVCFMFLVSLHLSHVEHRVHCFSYFIAKSWDDGKNVGKFTSATQCDVYMPLHVAKSTLIVFQLSREAVVKGKSSSVKLPDKHSPGGKCFSLCLLLTLLFLFNIPGWNQLFN